MAALAAVLLSCLLGFSAAGSASPVEKVIAMLQENKLKIQRNLAAERKEMEENAQFCDDETSEKNYAIKTAARKIADLTATIDDATAQVKGLDDEIAELGNEMAGKDDQMSKAKKVRKSEHTDFEATEKELVESVDQLEKAIILLKRGMSFAQTKGTKPELKKILASLSKIVDAAWVDQGSKKALRGLLQQQDQLKDTTAEAAGGSSSDNDDLKFTVHSHGDDKSGTASILQAIQDMKQKAEETLSNARMNEMKAAHNNQMMMQSLEQSMGLSKTKLSEATGLKATLTEQSGKANGEIGETKTSKQADMLYLSKLTRECERTASAWDERQKSAAGELEAIAKATEILAAGVKSMLQQPVPEDEPLIVDDEKTSKLRSELIEHLKGMGHRFHSYTMMEMVSAATTDPFDKIRGLISDMIAKLVAEANEEASQKSFCDEEKGKSTKQKDAKTMKLDELNARLDKAQSTTEELGDAIKELQAELADLDKATAEATKLRSEEHATFEKSSKDYKDSAAAVEQAIGVLKEFYASSLFLQTKKKSKAEDGSGAIIALLETSAEDFSRMLTEAEADEMEAKSSYDQVMQASKTAKASKTAEVKGMESEIKQLAVAMRSYTEDKQMTSQELDAVLEYLEKLKPQCETKVLSYAEKKAKREAEIEGLKEAMSILDSPAMLLQNQARRNLRRVA